MMQQKVRSKNYPFPTKAIQQGDNLHPDDYVDVDADADADVYVGFGVDVDIDIYVDEKVHILFLQ